MLLQEQHPTQILKNSPEDEEFQKIEILCGVAIHFDIIVFMISYSRKLVDRKKKKFYVDFKKKKLENLQNTPGEIGLSREITLSLLGCCSRSNTLLKS